MTRKALLGMLLVAFLLSIVLWPRLQIVREYVESKMTGRKTVADRLAEYGSAVDARLAPRFRGRGVPYPPEEVVFLAFKGEKRFEVHARGPTGGFLRVASYPILAASGGPGPKLKEGDRQVPEGIYRIESLNPNSLFHLSLRLDYPNGFDRAQAAAEGRTGLGGDIMIHGNQVSVGCIALGDEPAEDLFVLTARIGREKVKVIISPTDFRRPVTEPILEGLPAWTGGLYEAIKKELLLYEAES